MTREEAAAAGLKRYSTGIPCVNGHTAERWTSNGHCIPCRMKSRESWYQRNRAHAQEQRRLWYRANAERVLNHQHSAYQLNHEHIRERERVRRRGDRERVNSTENQRRQRKHEDELGRPKPTQCECCGNSNSTIVWDHDHNTGRGRGWICTECNLALGSARDDPQRLRRLADYVERPNKQGGQMSEADLRDALFHAIEEELRPSLEDEIERIQEEHQLRLEATLDKALAAITGEKPAKAKAKAPRKPRADKGRKRIGRGLPDRPAEAPDSPQEPREDSGPCCAACEHYQSLHEGGSGPCTLPGCGCEGFVQEATE